jgi:hypothetical protein
MSLLILHWVKKIAKGKLCSFKMRLKGTGFAESCKGYQNKENTANAVFFTSVRSGQI